MCDYSIKSKQIRITLSEIRNISFIFKDIKHSNKQIYYHITLLSFQNKITLFSLPPEYHMGLAWYRPKYNEIGDEGLAENGAKENCRRSTSGHEPDSLHKGTYHGLIRQCPTCKIMNNSFAKRSCGLSNTSLFLIVSYSKKKLSGLICYDKVIYSVKYKIYVYNH
jgi:hypothetical protein